MQSEKNLVEEALIQMKQIEDVLAENAKGILSSTMKEEIEELVKESLNEQEDIEDNETDLDIEDDMDIEDEMDIEDNIEDEDEFEDEMEDEDEFEIEDEMGMDDDVIDMRNSSENELLKVFKAMGDEDGIIVSKDDDYINLKDDADEYLIRLGEQIGEFDDEDVEDAQEYGMRYFNDADEEGDFVPFDDENEDIDMDYAMSKRLGLKYFNDNEEDEEDDEDEMVEMYEDDTQNVIDRIFESKSDKIIYEIEMDEQSSFDDEDVEDEFDMEDEMDMDEEDLDNIKVDCDRFSTKEFIDEYGITDSSKILKVLEVNGCLAGRNDQDMSEDYNYLGEAKKASKFKYNMPKNGFNEKMKEGPKKTGTGKAKFTYNSSAPNVGGKPKKVAGTRKEETKEASRTYGMGSKAGRGLKKGITPNRNLHLESLEEEVLALKQKNSDYKKSLNLFKDKLNDVAVFNANLAYATRLFTEHSTTKKEKINILRRFDNVSSLNESKNLYATINSELSKDNNTSLNESVNRKISNVALTGSSANLIESKTYENPQFLRMKDLMGKLG
jgi:hypothetical protein